MMLLPIVYSVSDFLITL